MLSSILLVRAKSGIVVSHASRYVTRSYGVSLPITTSRAFQSKSQSLGQSAVALRYDESEVSPLAEPRGPAYWQNIWRWRDISEAKFLTHQFQTSATVQGVDKLIRFLGEVLPEKIPVSAGFEHIECRDQFIKNVESGIRKAPMAVRIPPHILSVINWKNAFHDPIRRQFIPLEATSQQDHPKLKFDSLHEEDDSPVPGLVHRYPDKVLFLATSVCPLYCRFCTRSYAIGADTGTLSKKSQKPAKSRWQLILEHIRNTPAIQDVVVSGGDCYQLTAEQIAMIGEVLIDIPHVKRFRFATKGLVAAPSRILDDTDGWTHQIIRISQMARKKGKNVAIHTHFNHPNEITWVTRLAAQRLFENGVTVRNQTVLLKGVNDTVGTMSKLIRDLADLSFMPYYVYQGDMVSGVEDLRTPLSTILHLEQSIRGTIAGFMMPNFVVDLPGGGGKRLANSYETYDPVTGVSTFKAPAVQGKNKIDRAYEYYDPMH